MRKFLLALGILALLCSPAMAGKNSNGALIVHTNDARNYTNAGLCARFETLDSPITCEAAGTQTNKDEATPALIWCIAAFAPSANPGVAVIYSGLSHNLPPGQGYFLNFGLCGPAGSLEVPDAGWPDTGGNSVAFGSPIVGDRFFPYYYLNAYGFAGAFVGTGINPTGGYAAFVDDSNPPVQDNIHQFGVVRWFTPGGNTCPQDVPVEGACCFPDGSCIVTPPSQCSGVYQGDGTVCSPNPCPLPEACCFEDEHCEMLLADACIARGGAPQGPGSVCTPELCLISTPGACCYPDGTCQFILVEDCVATGGEFYGEGVTCAEANCPQPPSGACCFADGSCQVLPPADCQAQNGTYQGDGTTCDQVQCPPVATETTTWGAIKANYR